MAVIIKNSLKTTVPVSGLTAGELALTTLAGTERLWMKNSNNEVKNLTVTDEERAVLNRLSIVNGNLQISGNTYSTGELSAFGSGTGSTGTGGGLISTVLDSSDLSGTYSDSDYSNTFNAYTIANINSNTNNALSRIGNLESGSATSIQNSGAGNVITNITKSGTTLSITKGATAILEGDSRLTDARKNPYTLSFSGYQSGSYDGSSNTTIAIPSKVSQLTNDSAYLTSISKSQVEGVLTGNITTHTHNQYLTGNQNISISGDITGSGTTGITATLKNTGTAGTYRSVTTDAQGRVTAGTNPTTLSGYGITDALSSSGGSISGNLSIGGNLTINGTTTTVNSTTVTIDDPILTLGGDTAPTVDDSKDRGIEYKWHNGTAAKVGFFGMDDSTGYFSFIPDAVNSSEVFSGALGDMAATNFRGALVGNATTATNLSTSRNFSIGGASGLSGATIGFNGGADVALQLGGTLKVSNGGTNMSSLNQGGIVYGASTSGMASTAAGTAGYVLVSNGTSAPTWNKLDLTYMPDSAYKKNVVAATTTNLNATGTTTTLTATAVGALILDGVTIAVNDRVLIKNQTDNTKNGIYVVNNVGSASTVWTMTRATSADSSLEIAGGTVNVNSGAINGGHLFSNNFKSTDTLGSTAMPWYWVYSDNDSATANTANKLVLRDGSGNFSAGTITASLSGNATSATSATSAAKLTTARTIALSGNATGSATFDGSGNITIVTTVTDINGGTW
nr:hypothetical protein [uncultured Bacteroides sp.]